MNFFKCSLLSCALLTLSLISAAPVTAQSDAQSKAKNNGPLTKVKEVDNNHRRLALSIPGVGSATLVVSPAAQKGAGSGKPGDEGEKKAKKGRLISVRVPESVDDALTFAQSASAQAGRYASEGIKQAGKLASWIGVYFKQWSKQFNHSTYTPAGSPYIGHSQELSTQVASGQKLYLTREGRLKTVISR